MIITKANAPYVMDNVLDTAYADAWRAKDYSQLAIIGSEIVDRLTAPISGFLGMVVSGVTGMTRFRQYDQITSGQSGISQVQSARQSTVEAVKTVATVAADTVKSVAYPVATVAFIGAGLVFLYLTRGNK